MATVYCLQHGEYRDKPTSVQFMEIQPRLVREDKDELGRVTRYFAQGAADVTDEAHLLHFRNRPWLFHVAEPRPKVGANAEAWAVQHRAGPWYDVKRDGERANEKALSQEDAEALAAKLNGGG